MHTDHAKENPSYNSPPPPQNLNEVKLAKVSKEQITLSFKGPWWKPCVGRNVGK